MKDSPSMGPTERMQAQIDRYEKDVLADVMPQTTEVALLREIAIQLKWNSLWLEAVVAHLAAVEKK